jgi:membrane protease YdiL (CAAX protease family)
MVSQNDEERPRSLAQLLAFFALSFALAWIFFFAVASQSGSALSPIQGVLATLGAFAPGVSAVLLTWRAEGRAGVERLIAPAFRWQVAARWYVFALFYLLGIKLLAAVVLRVTTGHWPRFGTDNLGIIPFAIAISTFFQAGEEIGWRGYALPRLAERMGLSLASLALGVIWASWHLPLFYARGADKFQQSFGVYALTVIAMSVAAAWLFARTGSLWIVMVMHAAVNNTKDIVPSATQAGRGVFGWAASPMSWTTLAILWMVTIVLLMRMPRRLEANRS